MIQPPSRQRFQIRLGAYVAIAAVFAIVVVSVWNCANPRLRRRA
jgi:hypothetical protein